MKCFGFCECESFIAWNAFVFTNQNHSLHEMLWLLQTCIIHRMKCFCFCEPESFIAWNALFLRTAIIHHLKWFGFLRTLNNSLHEMLLFLQTGIIHCMQWFGFCKPWIIHRMKCCVFSNPESFIACNALAFCEPWIKYCTTTMYIKVDWYIALFRELAAHVSFSKWKSYSKNVRESIRVQMGWMQDKQVN